MFVNEDTTRVTLRYNALASGLLAVGAGILLYRGDIPFPKVTAWVTLLASIFYIAYFVFFEHVCRHCFRPAGIALSMIGSVLITVSIYYTGGIVSPLPFLFLAMLVSEAIYGLENPLTVPISAVGYVCVVASQYWKILPNPAPWSEVAYQSPAFVLVVTLLVVAYLFLTKGMSDRILRGLRGSLEREAAERTAMLKKFSELDATSQIGSLAHRIAHDLRAPLSSISGYVQMELMKKQSADTMSQLNDLNDTVNSMAESLTCITRFGKESQLPAERINVAEFFRQLLAIAAFSPMSRGVKFVRNYSDRIDAWVTASRSDMQQAYFNILKNALEATRDNATGRLVEVSIRLVDKEVEICISDNGPGMSPEVLKDLFRKSITTKKDGTGVGLVITRDILTRNDGYVEFRNREGGGLKAVTRLPSALDTF